MKRKRRIRSPTHSESKDDRIGLDYEESFDLPEEIIREILLRLPVKSISKFRCVSKAWLSLISTQQFIKTHIKFSTENSNLNGLRVIFTTPYPPSHLNGYGDIFTTPYPPSHPMRYSAHSLLCHEPSTATLNIGNPMRHSPQYVSMVGSCNGLICIALGFQDLILWNPSIKKSKKVPSMIPKLNIFIYMAYGFGFDESDDDYKVMGIFSVIEEYRSKNIVMVYSLATDSWKRVGNLEGGIPLSPIIKFASGKAHWSATRPNYRDIVCLDLESGEYGMVKPPDYGKCVVDHTLGVLGGCISVLSNDLHDHHVDVWVLKEYGVSVEGSWRKVFHFSFHVSCVVFAAKFASVKPLCLLPNGEILLICGRSYIVCNPRYGSIRVLKATNLDFSEVDIFVESLVSL